MQRLLRFTRDDEAPNNIALAAIRDARDRAGILAPETMDVNVDLKIGRWCSTRLRAAPVKSRVKLAA